MENAVPDPLGRLPCTTAETGQHAHALRPAAAGGGRARRHRPGSVGSAPPSAAISLASSASGSLSGFRGDTAVDAPMVKVTDRQEEAGDRRVVVLLEVEDNE